MLSRSMTARAVYAHNVQCMYNVMNEGRTKELRKRQKKSLKVEMTVNEANVAFKLFFLSFSMLAFILYVFGPFLRSLPF